MQSKVYVSSARRARRDKVVVICNQWYVRRMLVKLEFCDWCACDMQSGVIEWYTVVS